MNKHKIEELKATLNIYYNLVDEFDYKKNGIPLTKDFIKYLLYEFYKQATDSTE